MADVFALKDEILHRRMEFNQKDAWETASGAVNGEAFLVIPDSLDVGKNGLKVRTVLADRICVQLFSIKFAASGNAFEQRASKFVANHEH